MTGDKTGREHAFSMAGVGWLRGLDGPERGRYLSAGHKVIVAPESDKHDPGQDREAEIERLTQELSGLINEAGTQGREELREYALSLIQAETETTHVEEPPQQEEPKQELVFNPLALSIPLVLLGILLLLLFPPVGVVILLFAVVMAVGGGLYTLLFHRR